MLGDCRVDTRWVYPRCMAGKPAEHPPEGDRSAIGQQSEREGPLAVSRSQKADGRALILYRDERRADELRRPA